jgi:hypothetical protein
LRLAHSIDRTVFEFTVVRSTVSRFGSHRRAFLFTFYVLFSIF